MLVGRFIDQTGLSKCSGDSFPVACSSRLMLCREKYDEGIIMYTYAIHVYI